MKRIINGVQVPISESEFQPLHGCNCSSIGVGDLVAGCTRITGVAWAVARFRGEKGCGCAGRRSRWNRIRLRSPVSYIR